MKSYAYVLVLILGPFAICSHASGAQISATTDPETISDQQSEIQRETTKLIISDAKKMGGSSKKGDPVTGLKTSEAVVMDPYVVRAMGYPVVNVPVYVSPLAKFVKTGAVFENVGKKVSTRLGFGAAQGPDGFGTGEFELKFSW